MKLRSANVAIRRRSAALGGTIVEGGPSNLLNNKKTKFGIRAFEPSPY